MGAKKTTHDENPEFVSTTWIAKKITRDPVTVRREIKSGRMKAVTFNGDFLIKFEDYLEWKAKYFKPLAS